MARTVLELSNRKQECKVCGFDLFVDTAHVKGITKFTENVLLAEVNAIENLEYLCPNHHKMFDRGYINLAG